jgi:hypothetical protein
MASVSFDDVAKVYPDGTQAVSGFDLEITDGEFMVQIWAGRGCLTVRSPPAAAAQPVYLSVYQTERS